MSDFEQLRVQDSVFALAASDGAYFAGRSSGLYRSDDGGQTWQNAYGSLDIDLPLATMALAAQGRHLFAGVKGGVLRSSDNGHTWFIAGLPNPPPLVVALALSPNFADDGALLAGTAEDGVFASTDRGKRWTPWNFGLIDLNLNSMAISPDFARDQMAFVGTESGIFRSKNGGRAWHALPFPFDAAPVVSLSISPDFTTDNTLLAGTECSGLYVSTDRGQTWRPGHAPGDTAAVNAMFVSDNSILLVRDDRVVESRDQGLSWTTVKTLSGQSGMALLVDSPSLLVGLAEGGILVLNLDDFED